MIKFASALVALVAFASFSAPASAQVYGAVGVEVGVGRPAPLYNNRAPAVYEETYGRRGSRSQAQCPQGYTLMAGKLECKGPTITNPAEMQDFVETVAHGCVEGSPVEKRVEGIDLNGRKTWLLVKGHMECNRNRQGS